MTVCGSFLSMSSLEIYFLRALTSPAAVLSVVGVWSLFDFSCLLLSSEGLEAIWLSLGDMGACGRVFSQSRVVTQRRGNP